MNRTHITAAVLAAGAVLAPATANAGVISAGVIAVQAPTVVAVDVPTAANPSCMGAGTARGPWMELCGYMRGGQRGTLVLTGRLHGRASAAYDARVIDHGVQATRITGTIRLSASYQQLGTVPGFVYSGRQGAQQLCLAVLGASDCDDL